MNESNNSFEHNRLTPVLVTRKFSFHIDPFFILTIDIRSDQQTGKQCFAFEVSDLMNGSSEPLKLESDWHDFKPKVSAAPHQQPDPSESDKPSNPHAIRDQFSDVAKSVFEKGSNDLTPKLVFQILDYMNSLRFAAKEATR